MEFKYLDEKQVAKYSTLDIEKFAAKENFEKAAQKLMDGRKVLKGEKAQTEFKYEYDEILEEIEVIRDYEIEELKTIIPKTWNFISKVKGSSIFKSIKKGKLVDGLVLETNVEKKIKDIEENPILDENQKESKIQLRKDIKAEIENFKEEKGEEWVQDTVWKIWQVAEMERVKSELIAKKGQAGFEKYMEKCRAIGLEKLNQIADKLYDEEED